MKEQLKNLVINWTPHEASRFHEFAPNRREDSYIWKSDDNGTFLCRDIAAYYLRNDGAVYKLTSLFDDLDWRKHTQLHILSEKYKTFRIDIPIEHEYMEFNGKRWFYSIVQRPANRLGITFFHNMLKGTVDEKYFIDFIDQACILLPYLKEIASEDNGLPDISLPIHKLMFDHHGPFWVDFKNWCLPYDKYIEKSISMVRDFSLNASNLLNINLGSVESIARDKWMKI